MAKAQVELILASDGVEGDVVGYDKNGKKTELPYRIVISPYFFNSLGVANLCYLTVEAGNREVSRGVVQLSGSSGKIKTLDRSAQHAPKFAASLAGESELAEGEEYTEELVEEEETEG